MRNRISALFVLLLIVLPTALSAQEPNAAPSADENKPTLQQRLMPENAAKLLAPAPAVAETENKTETTQPMVAARGAGVGLMIAGGALFLAGLIIGGDAGTVVAVAGAAIGAYGLYQYFN
jgi:hypothetical protein